MSPVPMNEAGPEAPREVSPPPASRPDRVARRLLWVLGPTTALLVGASVYVQSPGFRARVTAAIEAEVAGSIRGRLSLTGLSQLSFSGARLDRLELKDEHGEPVLALEGIHVRYDPFELLATLLPGADAGLSVEHVRVERSRVLLRQDERSGEPSLVRAFGTDRPSGSASTTPAVYAFPSVELGEVALELDHPALGRLAAGLHHVRGKASIAGDDTEVSVHQFGVLLRQGEQRWLEGTGSLWLLREGVLGGTFHGFVRGTELDASAQLEGGLLEARLDVPRALPERLREVWPGYPLQVPVGVRLGAEGPLEALAVDGDATTEHGRLTLRGDADLGAAPRLRLEVGAHAIDARLFAADAPETAIDAVGSVELSSGTRGVLALAAVTTEPTTIGPLALPGARLTSRSEGGDHAIHLELADARAALQGDVRLSGDGPADIELKLSNLDLSALPELRGGVLGRADLVVRARVGSGRFSGNLTGSLRGVELAPLELDAASLQGSFEGSFAALDDTALQLSVAAQRASLGTLETERVNVTARGTWHTSRLEAALVARGGGAGSARGRLSLRREVLLEDVALSFEQRGVSLEAHVEEYRPERGVLRDGRLSLGGRAGTLQGSLSLAPARLDASASAERLDTQLLLSTLGFGFSGARASISGRARFTSGPGEQQGELKLHADKVSVQSLSWQALDVSARLEGAELQLETEANDPNLGRLALAGSARLAGPLHEPGSWQRATGSGSASLQRLPLWPVGLILPEESRLKELDGRLEVNLAVERTDASAFPDLLLDAKTDGLAFVVGASVPGEDDRRFDAYAVHGSASLEGRSGLGTASVRVTDENGALVTTSGVLDVDLPALLREPGTILERLLKTPLDALVRVHPRPLSQLPPPFGLRDLGGNVEASLQLRGSLAEPTLSLVARGKQLQGGLASGERAVDVTTVLEYAPGSGRLRGTADVVQSGKGLVAARLEGKIPNPLAHPARLGEVQLRAAAMLNGVPLELWPVLARERMEARVYGSVELEIQPGEPSRQRAHLEIADLTARGHLLGNGRLTLQRDAQGLRADLRVGSRERYLRSSLLGPPGAPSADQPVRGTLVAQDFDAGSLSPLTSGLLSRLGGDMDAQLEFSLKRAPDDWYLGIDGVAKLENGTAHVDELGLEVRDIAADLRARSTPEYTVLQIDPLRATARARSANLRGDIELWLRGLRVQNGEADLTLNDLPLSLKGVSRGIARGQVLARLERMPDHLALEVRVPDLRVRLPPSSTRALIELEENDELSVLQATEPPEELAPDALLWKIAFDLEDVRLQRGDFDVPLTGQPSLEFRHEVRPSGTIQALPGGRIRLFDQSFSIDRGLLQFVPDEPANPRVDLTASWRAPDGTTVYVDVTGRAEDASVSTRDDRGLQDVERFYLITGGAIPEGPELAAGGAAEGAAIGQTFSLGINELLRDSLGNVAVSIGTTPDDRASYSASVRLTDKLSFQGSFQPASESNLEESTNDLTGTLDYRISRRWSLRTELGTSGGAFDLLWSHRY